MSSPGSDRTEPRLTERSPGAGCGCKLSATELGHALRSMTQPIPTRPEVLLAFETSDDAGLVAIDEHRTLVQTLDFFTPIVDDPRNWGRIAATNALSDVYAMGGEPLTAMSIVAWPRDDLGWEMLGQVLDGGAEVLGEAGCALLGGHSIDDPVPKYGLSVTGVVDRNRIMLNSGGRAGDRLVLTKPLGIGVITTAIKRGLATSADEERALDWMTRRNDLASRSAVEAGCRAGTDVTGFGLIGHLTELARASGVDAVIEAARVPVLERTRELVDHGCVPGGTRRNLEATRDVDWGEVSPTDHVVLCDAQTSGGLLLAMPPTSVPSFSERFEALGGGSAHDIGALVEPGDPTVGGGRIRVR